VCSDECEITSHLRDKVLLTPSFQPLRFHSRWLGNLYIIFISSNLESWWHWLPFLSPVLAKGRGQHIEQRSVSWQFFLAVCYTVHTKPRTRSCLRHHWRMVLQKGVRVYWWIISEVLTWKMFVFAGALRIKDHILCSRFHAFARDGKSIRLETQHGWNCTDVARRLHHTQVFQYATVAD
jgi:hypothetical protein